MPRFYLIETHGPSDLIAHEHCLPKGLAPHSLGVDLLDERDTDGEPEFVCDICGGHHCPCALCRDARVCPGCRRPTATCICIPLGDEQAGG